MQKKTEKCAARPFFKWVGGKTQLLNQIRQHYPFEQGYDKYAEPFIGGGAVLFDILNSYKLKEIYISDINPEIANLYLCLRDKTDIFIEHLEQFFQHANKINGNSKEKWKSWYLLCRQRFNDIIHNALPYQDIERAVLFMFLNKTCFNGLYRVNKKGNFNVPIGSFKKPVMIDTENLKNVAAKLKQVQFIRNASYMEVEQFADDKTFIYFDPPYRPLNKTASFNNYNSSGFNDECQKNLANLFARLDKKGAKLLLSNSDPKNADEHDDFFDNLYSKYNIQRVPANRMLNSNIEQRGKINEIMVFN